MAMPSPVRRRATSRRWCNSAPCIRAVFPLTAALSIRKRGGSEPILLRPRENQRDPTALRVGAQAAQRRTVMSDHVRGLALENARQDQATAGREQPDQMGCHRNQDRGQNVGGNQWKGTAQPWQSSGIKADHLRAMVQLDIVARIVQRQRVLIDSRDLPDTQPRHRQTQNARAASHVEAAVEIVPAAFVLQRYQGAPCGRVMARAEALSRIDHNRATVWRQLRTFPRRHNYQPPPNLKRLE